MNSHRFRNAGKVTQFEIEYLPPGVGRSWLSVWCSVSNDFHPTSEAARKLYYHEDDDGACRHD